MSSARLMALISMPGTRTSAEVSEPRTTRRWFITSWKSWCPCSMSIQTQSNPRVTATSVIAGASTVTQRPYVVCFS